MKVPEYRVIIAGSVSFQDYGLLRTKCDAILSEKQRTHSIVVVSGTARGADRLGERYAKEKGYQLRQFPADWDTHGRPQTGTPTDDRQVLSVTERWQRMPMHS